jgi:succinate dehydrogenase / fumarate reductase flavoprotein subunit
LEKIAPTVKDLASGDLVSRPWARKSAKAEDSAPKSDYLLLNMQKSRPTSSLNRLPGIKELAETFSGVDCTKQPIPVAPTAHYSMGGIPTCALRGCGWVP